MRMRMRIAYNMKTKENEIKREKQMDMQLMFQGKSAAPPIEHIRSWTEAMDVHEEVRLKGDKKTLIKFKNKLLHQFRLATWFTIVGHTIGTLVAIKVGCYGISTEQKVKGSTTIKGLNAKICSLTRILFPCNILQINV